MDFSGVGFFARVSVYTPLPPAMGELDVLGDRKNRHAARDPNTPLEGARGWVGTLRYQKAYP